MLQPQQQMQGFAWRNRLRDVPFLLLLVLVVVLSVVLVLNTLGNESSTSSSRATDTNVVRVDFYGESLCPDCRHMVLDVLQPIMKQQSLWSLVDLRYIAYGNVRTTADGSIQCQHGDLECLYNRYINCAQQDGAETDAWFGFVACMAESLGGLRGKDGEKYAEKCAEENGYSGQKMKECATGSVGKELEKLAGSETDALVPKHTFVPWIVVNGAAIGSDFENLDRYICAALDGNMPEACLTLRESLKHQ